MSWQNWARNQAASPQRVVRPVDTDGVLAAIDEARRDALTLKAVGAGHSFTGIAVATGMQMDTSALSGLIAVDEKTDQVTIGAGTRLYDLPKILEPLGLAMINLGDIDHQTISGAVSTGTHGTGARFGGLATQLTAVTLATADGRLLVISPSQNPELWPSVRVGLGALGILVAVTIQCVPSFLLHAVEQPEPLDGVLEQYMVRSSQVDHFEFYWFPHTDTALTKTNTRIAADAEYQPRGELRRWFDDHMIANSLFGATCALGTLMPDLVPRVNRMAERLTGNREFVDVSNRVFTTARNVRFVEMEYALPREYVVDALREIQLLISKRDWKISFPVEVRTAAADDAWLSTATGRLTGYIAIHRYNKEDHGEYFHEVESIFRNYDGRPHWGKIHYHDAQSLRKLYPHFDNFTEVRDTLDPTRMFTNHYLDKVLGP